MTRALGCVLIGLSLCVSPARAGDNQGRLRQKLLAPVALGHGWEATDETREPVDAELRNLGLRETATRHYSRSRGPQSDVCTIELWRFANRQAASSAAAVLNPPNWLVLRSNALLVLAHGVRLVRGAQSVAQLHEECAEIGRATLAQIAR
jgi:hypothetical protein